jgi:ribosomal protein S18 acetylase RimI-like enzyme
MGGGLRGSLRGVDPSAIEITRGGPEDIDSLRELWLELHHHHAEIGPQSGEFTDDETSWSYRSAQYREWLGDPGSFLLLGRDGERLVAYLVVRVMESGPEFRDAWRVPDTVAEIETIVVLPEARGAGLGERLLDEADAELYRQGITEVMIGVIPGNDRAQALYERRGFHPRWLILARSSQTSGAGDSNTSS